MNPQIRKSTAITTAELLLINVWNEGDLKRRPMLIKCNCLIAKCWEPILRGFQWNYLISSQEVHCRKKKEGEGRARNGRAEKASFSFWAFPSWNINCGLHLVGWESELATWGERHTRWCYRGGHNSDLLLSICRLKRGWVSAAFFYVRAFKLHMFCCLVGQNNWRVNVLTSRAKHHSPRSLHLSRLFSYRLGRRCEPFHH